MKKNNRSVIESCYLSLIRIAAAAMVYLHHARLFTDSSFITRKVFFIRTCAWSGVWIFFILGGVLAGKAFATSRYELNRNGIYHYLKQRFTSVYLPTITFIFVAAILSFPRFIPDNPSVLLKFLTCTYRGNPGVDGIGATWYVFVIMWFYALTPLVSAGLARMGGKGRWFVLVFLIIYGFSFRTMGHILNWDWYKIVYSSVFANADLFFSGVTAAFIIEDYRSKHRYCDHASRIVSIVLFFVLLLLDDWIMNELELGTDYGFLKRNAAPSLFIIVVLLFLFTFELNDREKHTTRLTKAIDILAKHTFGFYLFHSLVLNRIQELPRSTSASLSWIELVVMSFMFTSILSVGFHRIFDRRKPV